MTTWTMLDLPSAVAVFDGGTPPSDYDVGMSVLAIMNSSIAADLSFHFAVVRAKIMHELLVDGHFVYSKTGLETLVSRFVVSKIVLVLLREGSVDWTFDEQGNTVFRKKEEVV